MEESTIKNELLSDNDNEVLSLYLKEINLIPLISHDEEFELAQRAKAGDKSARDKLIRANLRFVVSVAKKFRGQGLPLSDLIDEGNIGLMVALDKFEPEKGYHFISYAVWWIRQSIMKAISEKGRAIRLPLNRSNELIRIQRAQKDIMHENETSDPTVEAIAERTGLDKRVVFDLLSVSNEMVSFDSPVKKSGEGVSTFEDFLEDDKFGPEDEVVNETLKSDVMSLLTVLNDKERNIITLRYGLNGDKPLSLKEIGDGYGLTKERIRQIEKKALDKLREAGEAKQMDSYAKVI